jgi:uncharacterized membrane protein
MGFDDLARHMAGRDKQKLSTAKTADELVAEAAVADRRMARTRDLILGPVLVACGLALGALLYVLYAGEVHDLQHPRTADENTFYYSVGGTVLAAGMLIAGVRQTVRGVRATASR